MRILITGAKGFIGSYLTPELRAAGHDVIGVDYEDGNLSSTDMADRILRSCQPDIVVHLAAKVGRLFGEEHPSFTISNNTVATTLVARACGNLGIALVYASTSEAFGDPGERTAGENEHGSLPHNLYGLSKRWGEEAAMLYAPDRLQILRLSMPYGPGLPAGWGRAAVITFLWQAHRRKSITVHRGGCRCLCWVGDLVRGIRMVIEDGGTGPWTIGRDDNETTMLDVAHRACIMAGASPELVAEVEPPPNQTVVKRLSVDRLSELGWKPEVELQEGMRLSYELIKLYDDFGMPPRGWAGMVTATGEKDA